MPENRIFISAGEVSGDLLAAQLMNAIARISPAKFYGLGGTKMTAAGMQSIADDASILSTTGFVESVRYYYFKKLANLRKAVRFVKSEGIENLIVIDNQGFSVPLAKKLRPLGVKVFYYLAPHVSVWGEWNAPKALAVSDALIPSLSSDAEVYRRYDTEGKVFYAGNPVADRIAAYGKDDQFLAAHGLDPALPVYGLFPGSRRQEIATLLGTMLDAAKILIERYGAQILLPVSHPSFKDRIRYAVKEKGLEDRITILDGGAYDVMNAARVNIMASGTATLESALFGKPPVICYQVAGITFFIGKLFVKKQMIGLPNILLDEPVFPELLQKDFNPERIVSEVLRLEESAHTHAGTWDARYAKLRSVVGEPPVAEKAARYICERLKGE